MSESVGVRWDLPFLQGPQVMLMLLAQELLDQRKSVLSKRNRWYIRSQAHLGTVIGGNGQKVSVAGAR